MPVLVLRLHDGCVYGRAVESVNVDVHASVFVSVVMVYALL